MSRSRHLTKGHILIFHHRPSRNLIHILNLWFNYLATFISQGNIQKFPQKRQIPNKKRQKKKKNVQKGGIGNSIGREKKGKKKSGKGNKGKGNNNFFFKLVVVATPRRQVYRNPTTFTGGERTSANDPLVWQVVTECNSSH